eukprot:3455258-Pyramimonas_sp.AAC.1
MAACGVPRTKSLSTGEIMVEIMIACVTVEAPVSRTTSRSTPKLQIHSISSRSPSPYVQIQLPQPSMEVAYLPRSGSPPPLTQSRLHRSSPHLASVGSSIITKP